VGDEAKLLAAVAPTWVGADRAATARAAVAAGAAALVMDDGLQNPTLAKDLSLLVIDGGFGFGNGRVLPAGPLREPVAVAAARCRAAVLIGPDTHGALAALPPGLPVLRARLVPDPADAAALRGRRVLAFAGIARPEKFFASLEEAGASVAARESFPDHHLFAPAELRRLFDRAARLEAMPATTAKDAARLPPEARARVAVLGIALAWDDPAALAALLAELGTARGDGMPIG
jgi:tetraacyldisaccharide 4'-kinase